jgi:hypothetical protein
MLTLQEKTDQQLKMLLIETHLRCGFASDECQAVLHRLYERGLSRDDVVTLLVASELYQSVDAFYRKNPPQL